VEGRRDAPVRPRLGESAPAWRKSGRRSGSPGHAPRAGLTPIPSRPARRTGPEPA
jgi:hypothetical protein